MKYAKIIANDVVNGQGVCVSLFVQGCPLHCKGCFNHETWDFDGGIEIKEEDLIKKIINLLNKNGIQRNLSILGGEPMAPQNCHFVSNLITIVRSIYPHIAIWVWSGYTYEELRARQNSDINCILNNINYLIDGPYIEEQKDITLPYMGSRNQRLLTLNPHFSVTYDPKNLL